MREYTQTQMEAHDREHTRTQVGANEREYTQTQMGANNREHTRTQMEAHEHGHLHSHSHGQDHHKHVHSVQEKKAIINRLSRAIGHMEAVKRMVENDADCSEVLLQLAAVRSAVNNTGKLVLKNHISHCIVEAVEENDQEAIDALNQAIDKFVK